MRIILQETSRAHTDWPTYGDTIHECGRYNKLSTASIALQKHLTAMHNICGQDAWTHNHRLVYTNGEPV